MQYPFSSLTLAWRVGIHWIGFFEFGHLNITQQILTKNEILMSNVIILT